MLIYNATLCTPSGVQKVERDTYKGEKDFNKSLSIGNYAVIFIFGGGAEIPTP